MIDPSIEKASGRTSTLLSATICWAEGETTAFVRNISEMGALLEADVVLTPNTPIVLKREGLEVEGCVVWAKDYTYGVKFLTILNPAVWISNTSRETTETASSFLKKLVEEGTDVSSLIDKRLSEELAYVARLLESVAETFSRDAILCNRYATQLQNISIAIQMITEISGVLSASNKLTSIENKVTGPMKSRILR